MELTMTNGFSELSYDEMEMVDGGINWGQLANGLKQVGGAVAGAATAMFTCAALGAATVAAMPVAPFVAVVVVLGGTAFSGGWKIGSALVG